MFYIQLLNCITSLHSTANFAYVCPLNVQVSLLLVENGCLITVVTQLYFEKSLKTTTCFGP
jgi:hypothetical protein